jgi:hypothetical protein
MQYNEDLFPDPHQDDDKIFLFYQELNPKHKHTQTHMIRRCKSK